MALCLYIMFAHNSPVTHKALSQERNDYLLSQAPTTHYCLVNAEQPKDALNH